MYASKNTFSLLIAALGGRSDYTYAMTENSSEIPPPVHNQSTAAQAPALAHKQSLITYEQLHKIFPITIALHAIDDFKKKINEPILLLANLILCGEGPALISLATYYTNIRMYAYAKACYELAVSLCLAHSNCSLAEFYLQSLMYYPSYDPACLITASSDPESLYNWYTDHQFKLFKKCWKSCGCKHGRNRIVYLLSRDKTAHCCVSEEERINLLKQAADEGCIDAFDPLRNLYEKNNNYQEALRYCTQSKYNLYTKAQLYEKLGQRDEAEKVYKEAADMEDQACTKNLAPLHYIHRIYTLLYGEFLAKQSKYAHAQAVLLKGLEKCDGDYWLKARILLGTIALQHLNEPGLAELYYLKAAVQSDQQHCPHQLIEFYQQRSDNLYYQEVLKAYQKKRPNYCMGLLTEQTQRLLEQAAVVESRDWFFYHQSLKQAETLKALEKLIEKRRDSKKMLISAIQQCQGRRVFKSKALKLINDNVATS